MSRRKGLVLAVLVISLLLSYTDTIEMVQAQVRVATYQELKAALGQEGSRIIELQEDVVMVGPIIIRGDKKIRGNGHRIERSKEKGKVYGGSLFLLQGGRCELSDITISGAGKGKYVIGKVFGRLLEVRQGTLVIGENCILCDNINDRLAVDGGGALRIGAKGSCTMRAGEIRNNQTVSKGAGILVERGGTLTILGGLLEGNRVAGIGAVYGFDGRGGAIYSEGRVMIRNGNIRGNCAESYQEGGIRYGGIGAAIYIETGSSLSICGGRMKDNKSARNCPIWIRGSISLDGRPDLECIYIAKNVMIDSRTGFAPSHTIRICPSVYQSGLCIAKGKKAPFALADRDGYILVRRNKRYYIEFRKNKKLKEKESQKRELRKGEPQRRKAPSPTLVPESKKRTENGTKKMPETPIPETPMPETPMPETPMPEAPVPKTPIPKTPAGQAKQQEEKYSGYLRYAQPDRGKRVIEIWTFTSEDIRQIQRFLDRQKDPFSQETNQKFLQKYAFCKREGG